MAKLDELNVPYEFHDYKKQGIEAQTLQRWCEQLGIDKILNKRGTTWPKLSDEQKAKADSSDAEAIKLLCEHSSMIKRPIVEGVWQGSDILLCGYDETEWTQVFSNKSSG